MYHILSRHELEAMAYATSYRKLQLFRKWLTSTTIFRIEHEQIFLKLRIQTKNKLNEVGVLFDVSPALNFDMRQHQEHCFDSIVMVCCERDEMVSQVHIWSRLAVKFCSRSDEREE